MYELIPVTQRCYYIQSPARIGLYQLSDSEVILIDGGSDKDAGRKVRQILDANKWHLTAIYATHSHADHIGGCKYLQSQTGCSVYAPGIEADFTRHTVLEPTMLYGGYPPKELRNKFLMAQEVNVTPLTQECLPEGFSVIALPGHCLDMVGFRTPENVVFLADCLASRETLEKYRVPYVYDVAAYLNTLEQVKTMYASAFIPAHAEPTAVIRDLAQANIDQVRETADRIVKICREPKCFEDILQELFDAYGLTLSLQQYVLVGSTVKSYLAWLKDRKHLEIRIQDNRLLWAAL